MIQCTVEKFYTPKRYLLNGIWFGSKPAKIGFIFIHGLSASIFSHQDVLTPILDQSTMAFYFNNRGHDIVSRISKQDTSETGYISELAGAAHEVFTDSSDDIAGAVNLLLSHHVTNIYLVGHSTGCQKAIYYLSLNDNQQLIKGVILICPMSDYAFNLSVESLTQLNKATKYAESLVRQDKPHQLLPLEISETMLDAQRYLSLYSANSEEEIFSYSQAHKIPTTYQKIKIPQLIILAENDDYADRPIDELQQWFRNESHSKKLTISILKGSPHNLLGCEATLTSVIKTWAGL